MSITEQIDETEDATAPRKETLWVTNAELIRRLGVPEKIARDALRALDAQHRINGFPQKKKLWGDRRYWPAVKAWFDHDNQVKVDASPAWRKAS